MPRKVDKEKLTGTISLPLGETLEGKLRAVAEAQHPPVNVQELFRRAAVAIVRCHDEFGEVPMDMRLTQRIMDPTARMIADYEFLHGPGSYANRPRDPWGPHKPPSDPSVNEEPPEAGR